MSSEPINQQGRIGALDGWRGIAILLVVVDHLFDGSHGILHAATRVGATGVGLFFALSGFLITSVLLAEDRKNGRISLANFYHRRAFRILPPVLLFLGVLLLLSWIGILHIADRDLYSTVLLYRNYIPTNWGFGWYTGHMWSLMVEEHFYLFWPAMFILTGKSVKAPVALAVIAAGWRIAARNFHLFPGVWFPGRTDVRADSLLWGCVLAIVLSQEKWKIWLSQYLSGWIILSILLLDTISNVVHGQHNYSAYEPPILALVLVWPVLQAGSWFRKLLDSEPLVRVGRISYSLYIWQQFWLLFPTAPARLGIAQRFPINVLLAFICGVGSYYLIEQPFIKLGQRLRSARERVRAAKSQERLGTESKQSS